jgi:hypothetical protein
MKRRIMFLIVVFVAVIGFVLIGKRGNLSAQPQQGSTCTAVPKAWGDYRGSDGGTLIFEDHQGTLRFYYWGTGTPCPRPGAGGIRRQ